MIFSSNIFLFVFFPLFILIYFAVALGFRRIFYDNICLFTLSLFFYAWGNGQLVILLCATLFSNYIAGQIIARARNHKLRFILVVLGVIGNLSVLAYYKYWHFLLAEALPLVGCKFNSSLAPSIALPVGISFFTFMAISYLLEIAKGMPPARSFLSFGVYLSMFPHLVAGPIVRFSEIQSEIEARSYTLEGACQGVWRFSLGLGKKVLLADNLALVADHCFGLTPDGLTPAIAWVGALAYTFQIVFDFSGYTDMAIGLAKIFSFDFPENFNNSTFGDATALCAAHNILKVLHI